jgi:hypothetical protein
MKDTNSELSHLMQQCCDELKQMSSEEIKEFQKQCTVERIEKLRLIVKQKDLEASRKPRNQYKNNYYRD